MNKIILPLLAALLFSGCSILPNKTSQIETPPIAQQTMKEFQKVADAMASGKSVECVMTNAQEGTGFTYQVKGKMIRSFGQFSPDSSISGSMISDGEYVYTWSNDNQMGTKFKIPTEDEIAETNQQNTEVLPDLSDEAKQQEYEDMGYSIQCDQKDISDEAFVPPSTIQFQDLSQMMDAANQIQQKMAPNTEGESPEMTQEQIEAMMKAFGDQQ